MPDCPDATLNDSQEKDESISLGKVLDTEHLEIKEVRKLRGFPQDPKNPGQYRLGKDRGPGKNGSLPVHTPTCKGHLDKPPNWQKKCPPWNEWTKPVSDAHEMNLVGLAFSGGGIRSATFNLGVLQALADLKLLHRIDYLSTVSGGGYIGSWLAAWTKRVGNFCDVQDLLSTNRVGLEDDIESPPIRFLRTYSNYLTPQLGPFKGDTLAMVAIYLRNLLLNQSVIIGLLATLLLVPPILKPCAALIGGLGAGTVHGVVIAAGAALAMIVLLVTTLNLTCVGLGWAPKWTSWPIVASLRVVPLFSVALLAGVWLGLGPMEWGHTHAMPRWAITAVTAVHHSIPAWLTQIIPARLKPNLAPTSRLLLIDAVTGAILYAAIWVCAVVLGFLWHVLFLWPKLFQWFGFFLWASLFRWVSLSQRGESFLRAERFLRARLWKKIKSQDDEFWSSNAKQLVLRMIGRPFAALATGAFAGWLYGLLAHSVHWDSAKDALTFGVPLVVGVILLAATLHIGLLGTGFQDEKREWWGRLGGWMIAIALGWLALFWVAFYFPGFVESNTFVRQTVKDLAAKYLTATWILTTIGSVVVGNSKSTGKPGEKTTSQTYLDLLAKIGPYVFIVGLVCWVSWGLNHAPFNRWNVALELLICLVVTGLLSWRVDINQFSMHMFYRNRLVGCYLGATNRCRHPNRFTGMDPLDDLPLKDLRNLNLPGKKCKGHAGGTSSRYDGPYPIINMSLNLVKGKDLAWQERKAESFVMTPHFCGYDVFLEQQYSKMQSDEFKEAAKNKGRINGLDLFGYRPTEEYAFPCDKPGYHGPNLGLAMAISGAAASPNMGYYTTTAVAFLLTVFNVRLGQWLGNPRNPKKSRLPTPRWALGCLMQELFAGTNDESGYVYLSDGGHFDNMGLYELVKRRCGLIIVCDAEADPDYGFAGFGDAIKKCRIDLGIDIDIDTKPIVPNKKGIGKQHYAIGKIHYEQADMDAPTGKIIYIKASLTGKEPTDVTTYKKRHSAFPHEDTADQWFSESQFESYRRLGYEAVHSSVFLKQTSGGAAPKKRRWSKDFLPIRKEFGFEIRGPGRSPVSH